MIAADQEHVASLRRRHADAPAADILAVTVAAAFWIGIVFPHAGRERPLGPRRARIVTPPVAVTQSV